MKNIFPSPKSKGISRRKFLTTTGGITFGITAIALTPKFLIANHQSSANVANKQFTAWVRIEPDGYITIYNPAAEMGQGSMTALPVILAEELDADWEKVKIENSPIEPDIYGLGRWGDHKIMLTVGSWAVSGYYDDLRQAGAQARYVLLNSVAEKWKVPIEELITEPGVVIHPQSGQKVEYGKIVDFLKIPETIPEIPKEKMKNPEDFRLIGTVIPRWDIPAKVNGTAKFAMDVQVPDMVYATMERGKIHGSKPTLTNKDYMKNLDGVIDIVEFDYGIGIVTQTPFQGLQAKRRLKIDWSQDVKAVSHSCQESFDLYEKMASDSQTGEIQIDVGDFEKAKSAAAKTYMADYKNDYVYHAQMEPLNAVASVSADGSSAEIWAGTQGAGSVAEAVGEALGIDASKVKFNQHFLGGGLGRRSLHDYIIEAAVLSKKVGKPVKLIWTREDDLQYGMYRPLSLQRMQASVDEKGELSGLYHCVVGDGGGLLTSGGQNEFYDIPNKQLELRSVENGIRLKHWRAVGHGPNKFAIESFVDEIAADQGKDPLEFRKNLMKKSPKALQTLEKAAALANWGSPVKEGRARGIAFGERSGSLCTGICEISVDNESGKIKVHHFWAAVDGGTIVQPDNVIAQMEGGIIMGISSVLSEQLTIEKGQVQQSNFNNYQLMRMRDIPESIEIAMIDSKEPPQGLGEASLPVVGGAIANAFAALTGKRLRHLPFTPQRVLEVLKG